MSATTVENPWRRPLPVIPTTATLLQRVILPRAGDPMACARCTSTSTPASRWPPCPPPPGFPPRARRAPRGHRGHRAAAAGALAHSAVRAGAERGVVRGVLQRVRRRLLAALDAAHRVRLRLRARGRGRVDVYRTKADGSPIHARGVVLDTAGVHTVDMELDLRPFEDGGWYWFDLTTDDDALTLHEGGWHAPSRRPGRAAVTIGMPTFNRPADCVATLTAIGEDPLVLAAVTAVIIPDQGTRKVRDAARVRAGGGRARRPAADHRPAQPRRLRRLRPGHVRGAGATECEQILFMDDDILLEPDSVLRAVAFSRFAREPMLVGGQMLSLQARSQLSTMGEVVDRHKFLWRNAPQTEPHHDLAERPLRQTALAAPARGRRLQRLVDVPDPAGGRRGRRAAAAAVHQVGRRRVRPAGPVARLPHGDGAGHRDLAHVVPREGRHQRLAGLLPLPQPARRGRDARPGRPEGAAHRHPQAHRAAPHAHGVLGRGAAAHGAARLPRRARRRCSQPARGAGAGPRDARGVRRRAPAGLGDAGPAEQPGRARGAGLPGAAHHQAGDRQGPGPQPRPQPAQPDPAHHEVPQRNVSSRQAQWFVLSQVDSATVSTPDGRGVTFRRRDPQLFRPSSRPRRSCWHGGPRVARPAPPLPRGGPAPHEPRGVGARDVRAP